MMIFEIKIYNIILTEKQYKYLHYHLEKLINMNILQVQMLPYILPSDQKIIDS